MVPVGRSLLECMEMLLQAGHPLLIIRREEREAYIAALKQIRTDEHLVAFFFRTAISRMQGEMTQKTRAARPMLFF